MLRIKSKIESMTKIRAIGFDFSGVVGGYLGDVDVSSESSKILGIDKDVFKKAYFSMNHLINSGEIKSWDEFLPILLKKLDKIDKLEEIKTFHKTVAAAQTHIDQAMLTLIDQLRSSGYKTGLLSNNTSEVGTHLRSIGLHLHFDSFIISADHGLQKPDPEVFKLFATQLGVDLPELVFIDDTERSLSTATMCGYHPIRFTSRDQLVGDLTKLKVL